MFRIVQSPHIDFLFPHHKQEHEKWTGFGFIVWRPPTGSLRAEILFKKDGEGINDLNKLDTGSERDFYTY